MRRPRAPGARESRRSAIASERSSAEGISGRVAGETTIQPQINADERSGKRIPNLGFQIRHLRLSASICGSISGKRVLRGLRVRAGLERIAVGIIEFAEV